MDGFVRRHGFADEGNICGESSREGGSGAMDGCQ